MDSFLLLTNERLKDRRYSSLSIVLGNESCDLDSAVSALSYATFLFWQHEQIKCKSCTRLRRDESTYKDDIYVPILNVKREDYELKTEIVFCMKELGVDVKKFIFRDDYNFEQLITETKSTVTLVDHHILGKDDLFFKPYVTEIIDHRPLDTKSWDYAEEPRATIEVVGSNATLVTERIKNLSTLLNKNNEFFETHPVVVKMLYSTIILDTVNFSKSVDKGTPKDMEMLVFLEKFITCDNHEENRKAKLDRLVRARTDVSSLTAGQLLRKDVKVVGHVLIPSFPILVEEFLQKPEVDSSISQCLEKNQCSIALLLGMSLSDSEVERDLAVWCKDQGARDKLSEALKSWSAPALQLSEASSSGNCVHYKQLNRKASRKQIVPAVQKFLSDLCTANE